MTQPPYTATELRTKAAAQHVEVLRDPDSMGIGERMSGDDMMKNLSPAEFDAAQQGIAHLLANAADVSPWAIDLGADGLEPDQRFITFAVAGRPIARIHFAFDPHLPDKTREALVQSIDEKTSHELRLAAGC